MEKIKFDYSKAGEFVNDNEIAYLKDAVKYPMICFTTKQEQEMIF